MAVRALLFDFNGTLSDDEHVLYEVYATLFAEHGRPLSRERYVAQLSGLAEHALIRAWLGDRPDLDALVAERIERYRAVADGATVGPAAREAVRLAARRCTVAVVSGAARVEIDDVLRAAGLHDLIATVVSDDDVAAGKPDPASYRLACERLDVRADEALAFEDTEAGIASARAAGVRCVAIAGTQAPRRLADAELLAEQLDAALVARVLDPTLAVDGADPADAEAALLIAAHEREMRDRYGEGFIDGGGLALGEFLIARRAGEPVGCAALQPHGPGIGELKRMYVLPAARGRGVARRLLLELESAGRRLGYAEVVLETGVAQPESLALYRSAGYAEIPCYGRYAGRADSICMARSLR